ncbi:aldehyde dehydrogenase domain-containing protein [Penicillium malachiteum]|uniref:aldehyde dehydrogenase domain-containing protein n=1 Tax=Penicillium malachiteum TaxID=1324776 RepID=UPI002548AE74|nr:aldehyde dehydrogenase domain-containing protein [Penicillium malachiteum]KAJ5736727.1 aldehyde dehydrogenase domain-containing protein [Penicillium malachiteum]
MVSILESRSSMNIDFDKNFVQIIDGVVSPTKERRQVTNPANREMNSEVPRATRNDLEHAVEAARKAFVTWSKVTYEERQRMVLEFADAINVCYNLFSDLLVQEQGKPRHQAWTEVNQAIGWIRGMIRIPIRDETIENGQRHIVKTRYFPLEVVAATCLSWDFPMFNCAAKIAPALLMGNVIIVNPCPFAPSCGLKLVELAQCFFPPGVVQSLSGDNSLVELIARQPNIDKISFSRSTKTGKDALALDLTRNNRKHDKIALSGNDSAIIFPDVDIERIAEKVAYYTFLNSGQISLNIKQIYVHGSIFEEFKAALVKVIKVYKLGDRSQVKTTHGPIQNLMHYGRVRDLLKHIENHHWNIAVGGKIDHLLESGYFIPPTVIDRPPEKSHIDRSLLFYLGNPSKMSLLKQTTPNGHRESSLGTEWGFDGLKGFCTVQNLTVNKPSASIQSGLPLIHHKK